MRGRPDRRVHRWSTADTPRRACFLLGAAIGVFGVIQIAAMIAWSAIASLWVNSMVAQGPPYSSGLTNQGPLSVFFRFALSTEILWIMPVVVGVGGIMVYRIRSPRPGQIVVTMATLILLVAAIARIDIGGVNTPTLGALASPFSVDTLTALPFCAALAVISTRARAHSSTKSPRPSGHDQISTASTP
jgi:hypothetical protein